MKFMHLSDLHIGKRINEFSMAEEQKYILNKILDIMDLEKPDAVIIAGDIYDKSVPSAEAVRIFDSFLCAAAKKNAGIYIINGNHDSAERLSFAAELLKNSNVYIAPAYSGKIEPIELDESTVLYLMPHIKPAYVREFCGEEAIETTNDAVKFVISQIKPDRAKCNIIAAHQFVSGAESCDSEEISVGGLDTVDASLFDEFDYVALGHIHKSQFIKRETLRYCGTPLKYSFSEVNHIKSATFVQCNKKEIKIKEIPLAPLNDMRKIKGKYEELVSRKYYEGTSINDYIHITLTDEEEVPDAIAKLRTIYPNVMSLSYENTRTGSGSNEDISADTENKNPIELFNELYEVQNNMPMSESQLEYCRELANRIWEE